MRWSLILLFISFTCSSYGQNDKNEYKQLLDSAISIQANEFFALSQKQSANNDLIGNLYLLNENDFPYISDQPSKIKFKVINLATSEAKKILKAKGIHAWRVSGLLKGNKLFVNIKNIFITIKDKKYDFSTGGGSQTIFEYSCLSNKWVVVDSKSFGI